MRHFWNWVKNDDSTRTLYLEGERWFAEAGAVKEGSIIMTVASAQASDTGPSHRATRLTRPPDQSPTAVEVLPTSTATSFTAPL